MRDVLNILTFRQISDRRQRAGIMEWWNHGIMVKKNTQYSRLRRRLPSSPRLRRTSRRAKEDSRSKCLKCAKVSKMPKIANRKKQRHRPRWLIDLVMASDVNEEHLVFSDELKHNSTVIINAESLLTF